MAEKTLDSLINKQKQKMDKNLLSMREKDSASLSSVIDVMANDANLRAEIQTGSFTVEEVIEAAKYSLRAKPYDISVRHLKISDSPIYHDRRRNTTRWRIKRKKLDDMAELLIEKAREHRLQVEAEQEAEKIRQLDKIQEETRVDVLPDAEYSAPEGDLAEKRDVEDYKSTKIFDNIMNNSDYAEQLDKCYDGSITDPKLSGKEEQKTAPPDAYLEKVDEVLDKDLPSINSLANRINQDLQRKMEGKRSGTNNISPESLEAEKNKLLKKPKQMIDQLKGYYKDVNEGKMSPEVLKLYLNCPLMANVTTSEHRLYFHMVNRNEKYDVPSEEEIREYKDLILNSSMTRYKINDSIIVQAGRNWPNVNKYAIKHCRPGHFKNEKDARKKVFDQWNGFVHFRKNKELKTTDNRYYITCKPGKYRALQRAWWTAFNNSPEGFEDRLFFKMSTTIQAERTDNIVIYVQDDQDMKEFNSFIEAFRNECKKEDVLPEEKNTLLAGNIIAPGISTGSEPDVDVLKAMTRDWQDKEELDEISRQINPEVSGMPELLFSYNGYVTKALLLSSCIAKKKLGLKKEDRFIDNKDKMIPLMKRYFVDFMKLMRTDPRTMQPDRKAA